MEKSYPTIEEAIGISIGWSGTKHIPPSLIGSWHVFSMPRGIEVWQAISCSQAANVISGKHGPTNQKNGWVF